MKKIVWSILLSIGLHFFLLWYLLQNSWTVSSVMPVNHVLNVSLISLEMPSSSPIPLLSPKDATVWINQQLEQDRQLNASLSSASVIKPIHAISKESDKRLYIDTLRKHIYRFVVAHALYVDKHLNVSYAVKQDHHGHVLEARLIRSSGSQPYDEAIKRAIFLASPLPLPINPSCFNDTLEISFFPYRER